jgi:energy-coupling factor transporter ATP-binding protein EcfA2
VIGSVVGSAPGTARAPGLPERLGAIAELTRIGAGRDGFDAELLAESGTLLQRATERMRLPAGHTVVAIAGGTGTGKSTLFNALAGADFSPAGVTRPATRDVHACAWGMESAAPLLDWLGVRRRYRFSRASALDAGEEELQGLILLDLPDHDSVVASSAALTDRIAKLADMLIWVLDPQKYADAAVHNQYLIPLAGHAGVLTVVLSQADLLTEQEAADCGEDLRRLLDSEGLEDVRLYTVSGRTGAGLDALHDLLAGAVAASRAADERISADIDSLLGRYAAYAGGPAVPALPPDRGGSPDRGEPDVGGSAHNGSGGDAHGGGAFSAPVLADASPSSFSQPSSGQPPSGQPSVARPASRPPWELTDDDLAELEAARNRPPWAEAAPRVEETPAELVRYVPEGAADALTGALVAASGLAAVADGRASAREAQAARFTGWPLARTRRPRSPGGPAGLAPQSEVDNAITTFADVIGHRLPEPWPASVIRAARSRADEVPPALAEAVRVSDREQPPVPPRWRLVAAGQWLLLAVAAVALIVAALIGLVVAGVLHRPHGLPGGDVWFTPWLAAWLAAAAVVLLAAGWLVAVGCRNMAATAGNRERERATRVMREEVAAATRDLILVPAGREIAAYERFRRELSAARGERSAAYGERSAARGGTGTPVG